tara:strand:+ start:1652 stop:1855 length:204 start_codon:yes stop_codon:yes gene_type:complete
VIDVALETEVSAEEDDQIVDPTRSAQTYSKTLRIYPSTESKRCFARYRVISGVQRLSLNHSGMSGGN